ncbi:hypothetical protein MBOVa_4520 [Mycoplasmopsis bovis 8790]|nr:hypothetical protein MBOVa_4520 [Mycoplasmopsis bovis 8790]
MKKSKFLLLTSLSPIISLPFVAASCVTEAKADNKMEKDIKKNENVGEKNSSETMNDKQKQDKSSTESKTEEKGDKGSLKSQEDKSMTNDSASSSSSTREMADMPMKKAEKSEADKRPFNNVDASGYDIGRWYDKISKEDLDEFKSEFRKILSDISEAIKTKIKDQSTLKTLKRQFEALKNKLESKLENASTWDHIDSIVAEIDPVLAKI